MFSPSTFQTYAQWAGIAALAFAALTGLAFLFKWGIRFRLVGATGFTIVLMVGLFALGVVPFTRTTIPGAVRFFTVFDSGATQAVIAVPATITETELTATLKQAASDLFLVGRLGRRDEQLTIRARAVLHPSEGVTQPLYLGQIRRSLAVRQDEQMEIEIYPQALAQLPAAANESPVDVQTSEN
ncbi:Ycf51 family protein [Phormidium tenue FACHB-886]|nr:Ycf51 family protein [Phormidium tenue FACHB-886]